MISARGPDSTPTDEPSIVGSNRTCETSLADSTEGRKKPAMRPNSNDQGFRASYFEFVDCNFIKEPRPHGPKSHKGVFLRTFLNNFPTICSRQRIADSIAGFFVDRRSEERRVGKE